VCLPSDVQAVVDGGERFLEPSCGAQRVGVHAEEVAAEGRSR
jgi:hypothetical protein